MALGSIPEWLTLCATLVIIWELWHDPSKPHFGEDVGDDEGPEA